MKGWIVFGCILFVFWLIGMIRANIEVCYSDTVRVAIKICGIRIVITPKKKKKPPKLSDFTPKKYRKRLAKDEAARLKAEAKKAAKEAKKEAKKAEKKKAAEAKKKAAAEAKEKSKGQAKPEEPKKKKKKKMELADILNWVYVGLDALKALGKSFGKHFEIEAVKMKIAVGSEDAAQTAILYGIIVQMAAYLVEGLSAITNFRCRNRKDMEIRADFLSDKMVMDLHFIFKIRVWHIFAWIFAAIGAALKRIIKNMLMAEKPQQQEEQ